MIRIPRSAPGGTVVRSERGPEVPLPLAGALRTAAAGAALTAAAGFTATKVRGGPENSAATGLRPPRACLAAADQNRIVAITPNVRGWMMATLGVSSDNADIWPASSNRLRT